MKEPKEISFTDFFREDAFAAEEAASSQENLVLLKKDEEIPVMEEVIPAPEPESRKYWKALRNYFMTGTKTAESLDALVAPVLLAPYLRGSAFETEYPIFYNQLCNELFLIKEVLAATFDEAFKNEEARILKQNLPRLELLIRYELKEEDKTYSYGDCISKAMQQLKKLDVHGDEGKIFREQVDKFQNELLKQEGVLIGFSTYTPFHLLNLQLNEHYKTIADFLSKVKKQQAALDELLLLQKQNESTEPGSKQNKFDFAQSMIAFDKMNELMPAASSQGITPVRLQRMSNCVKQLTAIQYYFANYQARLFVSKELSAQFNLKSLLPHARVEEVSGATQLTAETCKEVLTAFVPMMAALQLAELDIKNAYNEDVHDAYFASFGRMHLSEKEMLCFPLFILIESAEELLHASLNDFSSMLSASLPIKVLAVNMLNGKNEIPNQLATDKILLKQELAAMVVAHRSVNIFQGAADTPQRLSKSFKEGLLSSSPAVWNVLFPDSTDSDNKQQYIRLNTAIESRFFPRLNYNRDAGELFGSRFDISANPQVHAHFPEYPLEIKAAGKKQTQQFTISVADYLAIQKTYAEQLEIIPLKYRTGDLIYLNEYLDKPQHELVGKIPFIWMLDEHNQLQQAAISFAWLALCKERLDFWQFIQELGGVNSYHVNRAIEKSKEAWEIEKQDEFKDLAKTYEEKIETIRKGETGKAMDRLVNVLLNMDNLVPAAEIKVAKSTTVEKITSEIKEGVVNEPVVEEESIEVSAEVWVESFRCTTCNDCTDKLPAVFKYNADKQAYVHDASKGTYAQIVSIAENCPAKCIHPGLPHNPNEAGAADLIKRAQALN
jgi:ferredoxin